jgi:hypothetical protein
METDCVGWLWDGHVIAAARMSWLSLAHLLSSRVAAIAMLSSLNTWLRSLGVWVLVGLKSLWDERSHRYRLHSVKQAKNRVEGLNWSTQCH